MRNLNIEEMMQFIKNKGRDFVKTTEDFYKGCDYGERDGIWLAKGDDDKHFDYYNFSGSVRFKFGVLKTFEAQLKKRGWYVHFLDAETIHIYPLN